jgi:hypothetical protein
MSTRNHESLEKGIELEPYITPPQLAALMRMSEKWVRNQLLEGRIPGQFKVGRYWRIKIEEVRKRLGSGAPFLLPPLPVSNYLSNRAGRLLQGDRNGH